MAIIVNIDVVMTRRKMSLNELAERVNITPANLSILKTGKAKAIRFSTLSAICRALDCQVGEILEYVPSAPEEDVPQRIGRAGQHHSGQPVYPQDG